MSKILLDYDPHTETREWFVDGPDETFQIYTEQDVSSIIEGNKRCHNEPGAMKTGDGDWLCARIPNVFVMKFLDDHGVNVFGDKDHVEATRKLLNSSDYRWLKTTDRQI